MLTGKSILIVGGTTGMGLSAALACRAAGAQLTIVGKDEATLADALSKLDTEAVGLTGNATEPGIATRSVELAVSRFGRLDGLFHVAGGSGRSFGDGPLHELTDEGWTRTLALNLDSVFYSNRAALSQFLRQGGGGAILNMSSVLAFAPAPEFFPTHAYATAKSAILGLTRAIASFYAPYNIRANALAPALVDTPMARRAISDDATADFIRAKQPLQGGRAGLPSDIDAAVVYFLSDASAFVTGQVLAVDGGWSCTDAHRSLE